ncbi:MAG: hypothetical protein F6J87_21715 [Spirulina sp. SIO3F2]|nr:hypothetical protein [Spirulina sp. SIO3F2]
MTGQGIEKGTAGILILILPFAIGVVFLYVAWRWLLGAAVLLLALQVWQQYQWRTLSDRLAPTFNQLLKENQGCLTAVDLALAADLRIETARKFLVQEAARYGGQEKTTESGDTVYYFLTASAIGSIFEADDLATTIDVEAMEEAELDAIPQFNKVAMPRSLALIQAELAKRLSVHSGTITKRKTDPSFPEWSCKKDPEGIAWRYAPKQKLFVPLDLSGS